MSQPPSNRANAALDQQALQAARRGYWRNNVLVMLLLLLIWAAASLGCGVLWADWLNQWNIPGTGFPLGFWFAQQGSILIFLLLILAYAATMNVLDRRHHRQLERITPAGTATSATTDPNIAKDI